MLVAGARWAPWGKDTGSLDSGAIEATEDAAPRMHSAFRRHRPYSAKPSSGLTRRHRRAARPLGTARLVRRFARVLIGLAAGWAVAAAVLFVWPPHHAAAHADAVVVLAGGPGPRLRTGLALVRRGVAPVLAISEGWNATWPEANRLCAGRPAPVPIVCFVPTADSTRGEAESVARLARTHRWNTIVLVSNRYHLLRARMLFERCLDGTIATADAGESVWRRLRAVPFETAKLAYALVRWDC